MSTHQGIRTERLHLRFFQLDDAPAVQKYAGDWDVARMTANIPYPYEDGMAEEWMTRQYEAIARGQVLSLAITLKDDGQLMGAIGLSIHQSHHWGELGYWIGKPFWNQGYCTEAARAVMDYGFQNYNLNRIQARHMTENPASGRVMQKLGMTYEGTHRQIVYRFGAYADLAVYAILREDYDATASPLCQYRGDSCLSPN